MVIVFFRLIRYGHRRNLIGAIITLLIFLLSCYDARSAFFDRKAEGWHWYEDPAKKKEKERQEQLDDSNPPIGPKAQLDAFKQEISHAKAKALMDPSYENIKSYMLIQKEMMDKATAFSNRWKEVLYTSPDLDYTIKHPVSQAARHVYLDLEKQKTEKAIHALSKTHGLLGVCIVKIGQV